MRGKSHKVANVSVLEACIKVWLNPSEGEVSPVPALPTVPSAAETAPPGPQDVFAPSTATIGQLALVGTGPAAVPLPPRHDPIWDRIDGLPAAALPALGEPTAVCRVTWASMLRGLWAIRAGWLWLLFPLGVFLFSLLAWGREDWRPVLYGTLCAGWLAGRVHLPWIRVWWQGFLLPGETVLLFPEGFASVRRGQVTGCRWGQIDQGQEMTWTGPSWFLSAKPFRILTFCRADGRCWCYSTNLEHVEILAERVVYLIAERVRKRFRAGETQSIGPFEISPGGLRFREVLLPWAELTVRVEPNPLKWGGSPLLVVYRKGIWERTFTVFLRDIPSAGALLDLLTELGCVSRAGNSGSA